MLGGMALLAKQKEEEDMGRLGGMTEEYDAYKKMHRGRGSVKVCCWVEEVARGI